VFNFSAALCSSCSKLLLCYSSSTCYSYPPSKLTIMLLLLNLLLYSFCSTYYLVPLVRLIVLVFLLDLLLGSFYSTYYYVPLIQPVVPLLLLDLLLMYLSTTPVILLLLTPFTQRCCFYSFYFRLVLPNPLFFCWFEFFSIPLLVQI
jgi:hypothetical protein